MDSPDREWLSLSQAAQLLGVHPTTLRRWADQGEVPVRVTPGGHRRFRRADVLALLQDRASIASQQQTAGRVLADYALLVTRQRLNQYPQPAWVAAFDEEGRAEKRELGRRLMGLVMQHISAPDDDQHLLIEARSIAARYALNCVEAGLSAAEGLEVTAFFRDTMTEVALQMPQLAHLDSQAQMRLLRKLNQVFNVIQISFVEYYDEFVQHRHS